MGTTAVVIRNSSAQVINLAAIRLCSHSYSSRSCETQYGCWLRRWLHLLVAINFACWLLCFLFHLSCAVLFPFLFSMFFSVVFSCFLGHFLHNSRICQSKVCCPHVKVRVELCIDYSCRRPVSLFLSNVFIFLFFFLFSYSLLFFFLFVLQIGWCVFCLRVRG